jgi:hypothetical protein
VRGFNHRSGPYGPPRTRLSVAGSSPKPAACVKSGLPAVSEDCRWARDTRQRHLIAREHDAVGLRPVVAARLVVCPRKRLPFPYGPPPSSFRRAPAATEERVHLRLTTVAWICRRLAAFRRRSARIRPSPTASAARSGCTILPFHVAGSSSAVTFGSHGSTRTSGAR